jgi:hypothetical protein
LRRGERGKVPNSKEEREGKTQARGEERERRTKTTFELELLFKEGEKRTGPTINITTFILLWFKCCVPYMHHTQGKHEHGQWSKYKASTSQTTLNPTRRSNHMNELKKLSFKCTS